MKKTTRPMLIICCVATLSILFQTMLQPSESIALITVEAHYILLQVNGVICSLLLTSRKHENSNPVETSFNDMIFKY